jgi:hypothetical protein
MVHPVERSVPFALGDSGNVNTIAFLTVDQMSRKDTDLVADAESSINEHVGRIGLEFNQGKWSYQEVVCPALPNHLFLQFTRNNGTGDVSVFSASIPRNGEGRVRIIPIQLRGYSLFSPAPINAMTISAFNHIRGEEHFDSAPAWLGTGLCYAALAGGHPKAALAAKDIESEKFPEAMPALLEVPNHGGATVSFADVAATPHPMEWTMIFDGKGKLLKAAKKPAAMIPVKVIRPTPMVVKGNAMPQPAGTAQPGPGN